MGTSCGSAWSRRSARRGGALNPGQVYVTLSRLERAGMVEAREVAQPSHPDKKVYELTASGRERVMQWLTDVTWSRVVPLEFHLKLAAAAPRA